ncbi:unnamed protein product [Trichobilharzia regenti]|nr:unnamed protein product [Trichobilharzia regenti]
MTGLSCLSNDLCVTEGDLLAEIETDKATMSFDANESGYLAKILSPAGIPDAGSVAAFKDYVAKSSEQASPPKTTEAPKPPAPTPPPSVAPQQPATPTPAVSTPIVSKSGGVVASPYARLLAAEKGLDLSGITGTGMHGMIRSTDLGSARAAAATTAGLDIAGGKFEDISISNMRAYLFQTTYHRLRLFLSIDVFEVDLADDNRATLEGVISWLLDSDSGVHVIAKRLTESKRTIPHYYLTMDIQLDGVLEIRSKINTDLAKLADTKSEEPVPKISLNDIIIKAASLTCLKVPECNSSWQGEFIRQYHSVDVSIAVAVPAGLITPIIFSAEKKGLVQINKEMKTLVAKAKQNKLQPHEFQGGTFSISNLGMFGISNFCAVINPPQACILAVGSTRSLLLPDSNSHLG